MGKTSGDVPAVVLGERVLGRCVNLPAQMAGKVLIFVAE